MRFFAQRQEENRPAPASGKSIPFISVVIPAHNEEQFLGETLGALARQDYPNCEVVVVANGCRDRTVEVAEGKCDSLIELKARGIGPARNTGAQKARGDLLLFLDADTLLEPNALSEVARQFTRKHARGTLRGVPDSRKASYKVIYFFKNLIHKIHAHHGSSGVILCWKDHFEAVGGFNNELYLRENSDLMKKLRRFGRYKYIKNTPAVTSMRRYEKTGVAEMIFLWVRVWYLSNFSDIRNQTYEGMTAQSPVRSRIHLWILNKLEKKHKEMEARNAAAG